MKKITLLFAAAACFLIPGLYGAEGDKAASGMDGDAEKTVKPILIRHGYVYSAEVSKLKPNFQLEVKGDQPPFPDPAWAVVMLKLPKNRGISRFDYELKTPSGNYPCLAVALGAEPFSQKRDRWTIEAKKEQEGKFVRMLFAFPATDLTQDVLQEMELVFKMRESACQPPPIPFRILPDDQALSANPQTLGENGNCGLSWLELHPELLPSLDDNPAESGTADEKAAVKADKKAEEKKAPAKAEKTAEEKKAPEKAPAKADKKAEEKKAPEKAPAKAEKKAAEEKKAPEKAPAKADKKAAEEKKAPEKAPAKTDKKAAEEKSSEKSAGKTGKKAGGKASKKKAE